MAREGDCGETGTWWAARWLGPDLLSDILAAWSSRSPPRKNLPLSNGLKSISLWIHSLIEKKCIANKGQPAGCLPRKPVTSRFSPVNWPTQQSSGEKGHGLAGWTGRNRVAKSVDSDSLFPKPPLPDYWPNSAPKAEPNHMTFAASDLGTGCSPQDHFHTTPRGQGPAALARRTGGCRQAVMGFPPGDRPNSSSELEPIDLTLRPRP